jgi:putative sigma-54 modulation protein
MQIHISPRHIKLTPAIHAYVAQKIGHLEHFCEDVIGAHIALYHDDTRAAKHAFVIKVHLAIPHKDIHAEDHGHELYAAIDIVCDKLAEQLRHRKSKTVKGGVRVARKAKAKRNGLIKA